MRSLEIRVQWDLARDFRRAREMDIKAADAWDGGGGCRSVLLSTLASNVLPN
jgi:hypothetical protein